MCGRFPDGRVLGNDCFMGDVEMSVAEMIYLVKKALQIMLDSGQENGNITIEIRRGKPCHVRFDVEVKPTYKAE